MQNLPQKPWHHVPGVEAATLLESDAELGLSQAEALERQGAIRPQSPHAKARPGQLLRFLLQFHQPLIYILLVSSAITAALQEWVDSSVIFGVVLVNAVIGFIQESKAENAIAALARIIATNAMVLRDGRRLGIPSEQLVPGDVVLLAAGDKVPADLRLLQARELTVDESALTGESLPVTKHTDRNGSGHPARRPRQHGLCRHAGHQRPGQRHRGGDRRRHRNRAHLAPDRRGGRSLSTPLTRKIERFSKILLYAILGLAAFTFVVGLARGETAFDMFMAAVALAVGAIPEGLPAAVTITLAIGVSRMARRRAIIRKLPAVETLGSTTVICSDKTGTLTENQMTVQQIFAGGEDFTRERHRLCAAGRNHAATACPSTSPARCANACWPDCCATMPALEHKEGAWQVSGDPTEGALIVAALKAGLDAPAEHATAPAPRRGAVRIAPPVHGHAAQRRHDLPQGRAGKSAGTLRRHARPGRSGSAAGHAQTIEHSAVSMAEQGLRVLAWPTKSRKRGRKYWDTTTSPKT